MAIIGPNGAGKSTLIKAALKLIPRAAGTVQFCGQPYEQVRGLVGYVPQRGSVDWDFPTTVLDVVTMGLYGRLGWIRRPGQKEQAAAMHALEQVGMQDFAERQISQLSGGQQQRTFLARALVQDARIYLMDEPFAAVDAVTERAIITIMRELRARGKPLSWSTMICRPPPSISIGSRSSTSRLSPAAPSQRPSPPTICARPTAGALPICRMRRESPAGRICSFQFLVFSF